MPLQHFKWLRLAVKVQMHLQENTVFERLSALHYSVDFIFLSFGVMGFIVELYKLIEGH